MLILTRNEGEKIFIGDKIIVEVAQHTNERVRLGIDAPPEMVVVRGELHGLWKSETKIAAIGTSPDPDALAARCG